MAFSWKQVGSAELKIKWKTGERGAVLLEWNFAAITGVPAKCSGHCIAAELPCLISAKIDC
jgi:hypothetical protein